VIRNPRERGHSPRWIAVPEKIIIIIIIIEIQRIWNVKTRVIPIISRATGTISKSFRKYVSTIPGN
jgi:hypothetical protein